MVPKFSMNFILKFHQETRSRIQIAKMSDSKKRTKICENFQALDALQVPSNERPLTGKQRCSGKCDRIMHETVCFEFSRWKARQTTN